MEYLVGTRTPYLVVGESRGFLWCLVDRTSRQHHLPEDGSLDSERSVHNLQHHHDVYDKHRGLVCRPPGFGLFQRHVHNLSPALHKCKLGCVVALGTPCMLFGWPLTLARLLT